MKKVLVIAAHPDDEILGVGATIVKHIEVGDECYALILGEGMTSRYFNREVVDENQVEGLHKDTLRAANIIGFKDVCIDNLPDNRFDSMDFLDVVKIIEKYVERIKPNVIYTHSNKDLNIDHRITHEAVLTATRPISPNVVEEIYAFETVSSTEWNFTCKESFKPNYFVDVTDSIDRKIEAIKCYTSEIREFPHPRSIKNLKLKAQQWGSVIGKSYSEAFEVIRIIK